MSVPRSSTAETASGHAVNSRTDQLSCERSHAVAPVLDPSWAGGLWEARSGCAAARGWASPVSSAGMIRVRFEGCALSPDIVGAPPRKRSCVSTPKNCSEYGFRCGWCQLRTNRILNSQFSVLNSPPPVPDLGEDGREFKIENSKLRIATHPSPPVLSFEFSIFSCPPPTPKERGVMGGNSKLKTQNSKLKTQNSELRTQNSELSATPVCPAVERPTLRGFGAARSDTSRGRGVGASRGRTRA